MNKLFLGLAMMVVIPFAQAQSPLSDNFKHHQIGLQVNQLVDQVLSLGSNPQVNNPYLLRYSYHFNAKQALTAGLGVSIENSDEKEGGQVNSSLLDFRTGYMWYYSPAKNLDLGLGADLVLKRHVTRSVNVQTGGFSDSTVFNTNRLNNMFGGGLRANITYNITANIAVGTEASLYYLSGLDKTDFTTSVYDQVTGDLDRFTEDTQEFNLNRLDLRMPVVLYLILRI